jgi:hypothetical protein
MQSLHGDLLTELLPERRKAGAAALHFRAQLFRGQLVLLGHAGDRLVDIGIGNGNALILRLLDLQAHQYQTIEYLLLQHIHRRQLLGMTDVLLLDRTHGIVQIALQDDIVVDDGNDAIKRLAGRRIGRQQLGMGGGHDREREQERCNELLHQWKA